MKKSSRIALVCAAILATASLTGTAKANENITPRDCIGEGCTDGAIGTVSFTPRSATYYGRKDIEIYKEYANHTTMRVNVNSLSNGYIYIDGATFSSVGSGITQVPSNTHTVEGYAHAYSSSSASYSVSGNTIE